MSAGAAEVAEIEMGEEYCADCARSTIHVEQPCDLHGTDCQVMTCLYCDRAEISCLD